MILKIQKIDSNASAPNYATKGDAGLDFYSAEDIVLKPGQRQAVNTGIKMEIPAGYVGLVWDKSGLALKNGIKTMAGVVDAGYRGEIKIVLINFGNEDFIVKKGFKIAQMLIQKIEEPTIEIVEELSDSERSENGFGSTGL
ncbi:dUTP diphosphatase [Candidatus Azambacteria bacterium]|nr:dUTP diphosphatase [Candidatus Azambacteria bacterium]